VRVLFTTAPLSGHFFPLVPLAWACRSLGHDVLVAASESFVPTVLRSGLPVTASGPAADFADLAREAATESPAQRRYAHGRVLAGIARRSLPGLTSVVASFRPDVVVSERAEFAGPIAAAEQGIPRVELRWGIAPLHEFRAAATDELGPVPEPDRTVSQWPRSLRLPHAERDESIRYVPYNGDAHVPPWALAPRTRPRVCITLGTLLPRLGAGGPWDVVIRALDLLPRNDIEFVLAIDDDVRANLSPLPANVTQVGRMPLAQVLPGCDGVLHHGGQGTSLTALAAGCPQLVFPQFDDQFENADAVVRAGAGIRLLPDDFTAWTLAKCTLDLVASVHFRQSAETVAAEILAQPSPASVVGLLESLGSSSAVRGSVAVA
jgi:UDP:flavonoid glycosyltransferase YjiC (YdhE family)